MKNLEWNIGDDCYIADVHIADRNMRFRVMPARVVHLAGTKHVTAFARSLNPRPTSLFGGYVPQVEGCPYPTRWSAYWAVRESMRRNRISVFVMVRHEGTRPELRLPEKMPVLGQTVYGIDEKAAEIFETEISFLRFEYGQLVVGFDPSMGNPEVYHTHLSAWYDTREKAERVAREQFYLSGEFRYVSKEENAARANARVKKGWDDVMARAQDPKFWDSFDALMDRVMK